MTKPKMNASKGGSMSVFNNKTLVEKYKKELEMNLIIFQKQQYGSNFVIVYIL